MKHSLPLTLRHTAAVRSRRPVPVRLQMETAECGAACLAMILSYYGRATSVADCRAAVAVGRDGTSARAIVEAAGANGLRARVFSVEPGELVGLAAPMIAHWNFNHFVVIERWWPGGAVIVDPARGRQRLTAAEFDAAFTGVVLTFEPAAHFKRRQGSSKSGWGRYLAYLLRTPGVVAQILVASLALQVFGLGLPLLTQVMVDYVLSLHSADLMPVIGVGMTLLIASQTLLQYLRGVLLNGLQARLDSELMRGFLAHLLALPYRFFAQRSSGDILARINNAPLLRETLTGQALGLVLDGTLVVVYLSVLLVNAPRFGLIALGVGALQIGLLVATASRVHEHSQRVLAAQAEAQGYLVEAVGGIETIKAAGAEDQAFAHWSDLFGRELGAVVRRGLQRVQIDTGLTALRTLAPFALLWFGVAQVLEGAISLGTMLALNALASAALTPLASLALSMQHFTLAGAHLERLNDLFDAEPEHRADAPQATPLLSGQIDLAGVTFSYAPSAAPVLRDISFSVLPGQKVALVGRSGSGKSTLARLLLGLYTPTAGSLRYDGVPVQTLNPQALRSQIGVVLQDLSIFHGSIRQNIAFNNPDCALEDVERAARIAGIHDEIGRLPLGYETPVGEGGGALSGGQRQRIALARAVAHRPAILLLDEATSHLDAVAEQLVDRQISAMACTRIVIAHRLSTIRNADLILVLEEGAIVERGSHEELMARAGRYAELVRHQHQSDSTDTTGLSELVREMP